MSHRSRGFARLFILFVAALVPAGRFGLAAQSPGDPVAVLRSADGLMAREHYEEAFKAYRSVRTADDPKLRIRAGAGAVQALLRVGMFSAAQLEGASIAMTDPQEAGAQAIDGDALWSSGLFPEADARYAAALALAPENARALHGRARSLASRQRPEEALADLRRAIATDRTDPLFQYTLGMVYEQLRRYPEAATALSAYAGTVGRNDADMAAAARSRADFLRSFGSRVPFQIVSGDQVYTVPFKTVDGHPIVQGRINGSPLDLVVDTGTEHAVISPEMARLADVASQVTLDTAGVGDFGVGIRRMQIGRIDKLEIGSLRVSNVTCLIASPSLSGMPAAETEAFSPLALGLSMAIDYGTRTLTLARRLPAATYDTTLELRLSRLPIVRGVINGSAPASFVLDTGSQATSLGRSLAAELPSDAGIRRVPAQVYGRGGWDSGAFLMPYVDLEFARGVGFYQTSMLVVRLDAPSWLLGFRVGGIIGDEFLSRYSVAIDLQKGEVGLRKRPMPRGTVW
jgi:predicted aspartyl protease/Flp pilus assembly protein TadD